MVRMMEISFPLPGRSGSTKILTNHENIKSGKNVIVQWARVQCREELTNASDEREVDSAGGVDGTNYGAWVPP